MSAAEESKDWREAYDRLDDGERVTLSAVARLLAKQRDMIKAR